MHLTLLDTIALGAAKVHSKWCYHASIQGRSLVKVTLGHATPSQYNFCLLNSELFVVHESLILNYIEWPLLASFTTASIDKRVVYNGHVQDTLFYVA